MFTLKYIYKKKYTWINKHLQYLLEVHFNCLQKLQILIKHSHLCCVNSEWFISSPAAEPHSPQLVTTRRNEREWDQTVKQSLSRSVMIFFFIVRLATSRHLSKTSCDTTQRGLVLTAFNSQRGNEFATSRARVVPETYKAAVNHRPCTAVAYSRDKSSAVTRKRRN